MTEPPTTTRRRTAFSLRTLMIIVALGAVGFWVYWSVWPRWQVYRQQAAVEAGAKRLKIGSTAFEGMQFLPGNRVPWTSYSSTPSRKLYGRSDYIWQNVIYCILYTYPDNYSGAMSSAPCASVALYRVQPPKSRTLKRHENEPYDTEDKSVRDEYLRDFTLYVLDDNKSQPPPMEFELLYSDPPAK
jgi:hypothetical protein